MGFNFEFSNSFRSDKKHINYSTKIFAYIYLKFKLVMDPLANTVQIQELDSVGFTAAQRQVF